jgi:hypothetical protein
MSNYKLAVLGVVALVAFTGCLGGLGGDNGGNGNASDAGDTTTVAVAVGIGAEAQQEITGSLNQSEQRLLQRAQLAPGNLSDAERERAQRIQGELQQAQQDAVNESNSDFESAVGSSATLSVEDSIRSGSSTLYLVSGSPSEVVGLLNESGVQAITSRQQFDSLAQQQRQAPGGGLPSSP